MRTKKEIKKARDLRKRIKLEKARLRARRIKPRKKRYVWVTVNGLSVETMNRLKEMAQKHGMSIEKYAEKLIRRGIKEWMKQSTVNQVQ